MMTSIDRMPPGPTVSADPVEAVQPQPFHRLAHLDRRTARWWRPLLVVALAAVLAVGMFLALALPVGFLVRTVPALGGDSELEDLTRPLTVIQVFGTIAVLVPSVVLATRWAGRRPGTAHCVRGRFRWGMLGRAALVVVPVYIVTNGAMTLYLEGPLTFEGRIDASVVLGLAIMAALVPLQAAGEEYVFRVLPQQVFGTWLRSPLWGILLPAVPFAIAHESDIWGSVNVGVFAVCMGVIVWKTGGVELAILVHAALNLTVVLPSPFFPAAEASGGAAPLGLILLDMVRTIVLTAGLCVWFSRREGLAARRPATGIGRLAR